jgi:N-acetylglucosamine kinase-like BadF-type ATPase
LVIEEADAGDDVASGIIDGSADQLVETAAAVARRLDFVHVLPVALTGGMLVHVPRFRDRVLAGLKVNWPLIQPTIVDDPALTAARAIASVSHAGVVLQ